MRVGTGVGVVSNALLPHPTPLKMLNEVHSMGSLGLLPEPAPCRILSPQPSGLLFSAICQFRASRSRPNTASLIPCLLPSLWSSHLFRSMLGLHHHHGTIPAILCYVCCPSWNWSSLWAGISTGSLHCPHHPTEQFACSQHSINVF